MAGMATTALHNLREAYGEFCKVEATDYDGHDTARAGCELADMVREYLRSLQ